MEGAGSSVRMVFASSHVSCCFRDCHLQENPVGSQRKHSRNPHGKLCCHAMSRNVTKLSGVCFVGHTRCLRGFSTSVERSLCLRLTGVQHLFSSCLRSHAVRLRSVCVRCAFGFFSKPSRLFSKPSPFFLGLPPSFPAPRACFDLAVRSRRGCIKGLIAPCWTCLKKMHPILDPSMSMHPSDRLNFEVVEPAHN